MMDTHLNMHVVVVKPAHGAPGPLATWEQAGHRVTMVAGANQFSMYPQATLYIDAAFSGYFCAGAQPLLFHAPAYPFDRWPNAPTMSARFCAWPGFWERSLWELALHPNCPENLFTSIFEQLGQDYEQVSDIAGLIAPRILCTIINEAAYTLEAGTANEADIDTAMKLGTNYPEGPIEWARRIGWAEVNSLLQVMASESAKYMPCPKLALMEPQP